MKLSMNEFADGVRKAAVGAGLPWGLADDLAAACLHVAAGGGDGAAAALAALEDGRLPREAPAALDRAACGETVRLPHRGQAELAIGFARAAAREYGIGFLMEEDDAALTIRAGGAPPPPPALPRVIADDDDWRRIGALAARTYVPSTEESRARGAGAGLTDND